MQRTGRSPSVWAALGAVVAVLATGCRTSIARGKSEPTSPTCVAVADKYGPPGNVAVRAEVVVAGLEVPWGIAFVSNHEILVTERPGRLRLVRDGALVPQPVATFGVDATSEAGLLGIALHPAFATNGFFYVYLTGQANGASANRVERWTLAADHASASRDRVILQAIPSAEYHDGGRLRFGPDGLLYVGTGDARHPDAAQNPDSLSGKLLRLTPDGAVPTDNPWPGKAVFLLGVRNTEGFDWFDAKNLVVTDHGPSGELMRRGHDEVNVARAGQNLGWPVIYGCEARQGYVSPSLSWDDAVPPGGAAIYRGSKIPEWKDSLLVGTLGSKHLHRVAFDADHTKVALHETYFQGQFGRLRDVTMGPDGELYVTTSNCDGRGTCPGDKDKILRITR